MPDNQSTSEFARKRSSWKEFVNKMDKLKISEENRPSKTEFETPFNPEGSGYDYVSAVNAGMAPRLSDDGKYHWDSRVPSSGLLLKGKKHNTWTKLVTGEQQEGYEIFKGPDSRFYSRSN